MCINVNEINIKLKHRTITHFIVCDESVCFVNIYVHSIDVLLERSCIDLIDSDLLRYALISKVTEVIDPTLRTVLCQWKTAGCQIIV